MVTKRKKNLEADQQLRLCRNLKHLWKVSKCRMKLPVPISPSRNSWVFVEEETV